MLNSASFSFINLSGRGPGCEKENACRGHSEYSLMRKIKRLLLRLEVMPVLQLYLLVSKIWDMACMLPIAQVYVCCVVQTKLPCGVLPVHVCETCISRSSG